MPTKKRRKCKKPSDKGFAWERQMAVEFSLWWSHGLRSDIFWRTMGSGGRARKRGRKGEQTSGQHGDIAATDPSGKPLMDLMVIELKKGYNKATIHDMLDRTEEAKEQTYETWIRKTQEAKEMSGSYHWMILHKRDRREPMFIIPWGLYTLLDVDIDETNMLPRSNLVMGRLSDFFQQVSPETIQNIVKQWKEQ